MEGGQDILVLADLRSPTPNFNLLVPATLFRNQLRAFEGEQTFSYSVRAVTPGRYVVPSLLAEAMYDPDVYGRSGGGETLVVAPLKY